MNKTARTEMDRLIAHEVKIRWRRSPTPGMRYVRCAKSSPGRAAPRDVEFFGCEVLGYGITGEDQISRIFYVRVDGPADEPPDGCGDYFLDDQYKGEPCDPATIAPRMPLQLPSLDGCRDDVIREELKHRAEYRAHWEARAKEAAKREAERLAAEPAIVVTPPKPKPTLWQKLWGAK